mmetsp:Transcript_102301/g.161613  ORF Transcript_102301/g.161613 Transcript_102301/m.161613 type:complete len:93 (-) Transcript_102301:99-377(-)
MLICLAECIQDPPGSAEPMSPPSVIHRRRVDKPSESLGDALSNVQFKTVVLVLVVEVNVVDVVLVEVPVVVDVVFVDVVVFPEAACPSQECE